MDTAAEQLQQHQHCVGIVPAGDRGEPDECSDDLVRVGRRDMLGNHVR